MQLCDGTPLSVGKIETCVRFLSSTIHKKLVKKNQKVVSPDFTYGDLLTAAATAAGVWQVRQRVVFINSIFDFRCESTIWKTELFGISRVEEDSSNSIGKKINKTNKHNWKLNIFENMYLYLAPVRIWVTADPNALIGDGKQKLNTLLLVNCVNVELS